MRRREFVAYLGATATAWPLTAGAQRLPMPVIGFLNSVSLSPANALFLAAFHQGLKEEDFVEGQNVAIEYRWAEGRYDRLPDLVADLVRRNVNVIVTTAGSEGAAIAATKSIPIVFQSGIDPVASGFVASLNRPGGNVTGVTNLGVELGPKQLDLLHEMVPAATNAACLINPSSAIVEPLSTDFQAAARSLGLQGHIVLATEDVELEAAFANVAKLQSSVMTISSDPFFNNRNKQLAELALTHLVPAIFQFREFPAAGGLMSYGGSRSYAYHLAGVYAGRILKGEKPADLPVQQTAKADLIINLKTAATLGIPVPLPLLGRADEVIE